MTTEAQQINPDLYRLAVFKQAIKALLIGMQINRGYTSTVCRNYVSGLTGKKYTAGKKGLTSALMDLDDIIFNNYWSN